MIKYQVIRKLECVRLQKLVVLHHPKSLLHTTPFPRPHLESFENPLRIQMVERFLERVEVLVKVQMKKATRAKKEDILKVHSEYLLDSIRLMSSIGSGQVGESAFASPDLYRSAIISAGGAIDAANVVTKESAKHSFSLLRPPGHHATTSTPAGLCYFNNIAIATNSILEDKRVNKVSIIDFDDHFGNGTAEIFYANPNVQYISIHEYDYENFGTGHYEEIGFGQAKGTNINIPMIDDTHDVSYKEAIERIIVPAVISFQPDLIGVSAGFDPHYSDPIGNMNVDSRTFWLLGKTVNNLTERVSAIGSFSVLEGGYNPLALGPSIAAYMMGLLDEKKPKFEDQIERDIFEHLRQANSEIINKVLELVSSYWK